MNYITCENCACNILESNFTIHQLYCSIHMIKCEFCQQLYDQNVKEEHENWHRQNTCQKCQEIFADLSKHKCSIQTVDCKLCSKPIKIDDLINHEDQCLQTLQSCSYCGNLIKMKDIALHQPLCKKQNHIQYLCKTCSQSFKTQAELENHVNFECINQIICPYCTLYLHESEKTHHLLFCGSRTLECTFCQQKVLFKNQAEHELDCFRKQNCQNNAEIAESTKTEQIKTVQMNCEPDDEDYQEYLELLQNQQEF